MANSCYTQNKYFCNKNNSCVSSRIIKSSGLLAIQGSYAYLPAITACSLMKDITQIPDVVGENDFVTENGLKGIITQDGFNISLE